MKIKISSIHRLKCRDKHWYTEREMSDVPSCTGIESVKNVITRNIRVKESNNFQL